MSQAFVDMEVTLNEADIESLPFFRVATKNQFVKARLRALKKTRDEIIRRSKRRFAKLTGAKQSALKKRIRNTLNADEGYVSIWIGINPLSAQDFGSVSGGKSHRSAGVKVGKGGRHFFRGAFQGQVYGSDKKVWIRKHSKHFKSSLYPYAKKNNSPLPNEAGLRGRFPLVEVKIEIAELIERSLYRDFKHIQAFFLRTLEHELEVAIGVIDTKRGAVAA